jgi:XapX domain-containing protein
MKLYLISLGAGVLIGVVYAAMGVRSPAPPLVALTGLLGMLLGEQILPVARRVVQGQPVTAAWFSTECAPKITGVDPAPAPDSSSHTSTSNQP